MHTIGPQHLTGGLKALIINTHFAEGKVSVGEPSHPWESRGAG